MPRVVWGGEVLQTQNWKCPHGIGCISKMNFLDISFFHRRVALIFLESHFNMVDMISWKRNISQLRKFILTCWDFSVLDFGHVSSHVSTNLLDDIIHLIDSQGISPSYIFPWCRIFILPALTEGIYITMLHCWSARHRILIHSVETIWCL